MASTAAHIVLSFVDTLWLALVIGWDLVWLMRFLQCVNFLNFCILHHGLEQASVGMPGWAFLAQQFMWYFMSFYFVNILLAHDHAWSLLSSEHCGPCHGSDVIFCLSCILNSRWSHVCQVTSECVASAPFWLFLRSDWILYCFRGRLWSPQNDLHALC